MAGSTVYLQDLSSSVYALDLQTGKLRWQYIVQAPNDGPNGLALADGRLFGATDTRLFALDARTGRHLWGHKLTNRHEQFVDIAPLAARGLVYTSTVGFAPGGRGALYALDQHTGKLRWRFDTIRDPWPFPSAGGGGAWYPPSLASDGRLYFGISNPGPWGGSPVRPNGGMYPGPVPYTDSLLALTAGTGRLLWYDQVTKHDVRDYDLEASPIVVGNSVYGAGKSGRVVAWDRVTGKRRWSTAVGTHLHDLGPLPRTPTLVCPGLWGGVLTPMAYARRPALRAGRRALHARVVGRPRVPGRSSQGRRCALRGLGPQREEAVVPAARRAGHRLRDGRERRRLRAEPRRADPRRRGEGRAPALADEGARRRSTAARASQVTCCSSEPARRGATAARPS